VLKDDLEVAEEPGSLEILKRGREMGTGRGDVVDVDAEEPERSGSMTNVV